MTTLLDVVTVMQKLGFYGVIFPFLLIFAIVYGLLAKSKPFGELKAINAVIALVVGFIFISFTKAVAFLANLIPALTAIFVVLLLLLLIFLFMGVPAETIGEALKQPIWITIIIFIVLIFTVIAFAAAFPELIYITRPELAPANVTVFGPTVGGVSLFWEAAKIFAHPTIVALIVMILIFAAAVYFITREVKKE